MPRCLTSASPIREVSLGDPNEPVMIFNDACEVRNHPDAEARKLIYG